MWWICNARYLHSLSELKFEYFTAIYKSINYSNGNWMLANSKKKPIDLTLLVLVSVFHILHNTLLIDFEETVKCNYTKLHWNKLEPFTSLMARNRMIQSFIAARTNFLRDALDGELNNLSTTSFERICNATCNFSASTRFSWDLLYNLLWLNQNSLKQN